MASQKKIQPFFSAFLSSAAIRCSCLLSSDIIFDSQTTAHCGLCVGCGHFADYRSLARASFNCQTACLLHSASNPWPFDLQYKHDLRIRHISFFSPLFHRPAVARSSFSTRGVSEKKKASPYSVVGSRSPRIAWHGRDKT